MDQSDTVSASENNPVVRSAWFLVGPTAVGKTAVAQYIAEQREWAVLSADSMLVYRGMDIGTAKPTRKERGSVPYFGLDLADVSEAFNVGKYIEQVRVAFEQCETSGRELLVVGGTGLYVKCLTEGLDAFPPGDDTLRRRAEKLMEEDGVEALQDAVRRADPAAYELLADKRNPRRLIRALEIAMSSGDVDRSWSGPSRIPCVGLRMDMEELTERIERRVQTMYRCGLLDEVKALRREHEAMAETALQAIGYAEAVALLDGRCSEEEAIRRTVRRTRQLAKRQMTWFRNQAHVEWVDVDAGSRVANIARNVMKIWEKNGRTPVNI